VDGAITHSKLMRARWRRRYVTVRRIVEALDRPAG
jgi:hypothetical protein